MYFAHAIEALKEGKKITRDGWDGKFIFMQVPATILPEVIPKMQSLPQSVKDTFAERGISIRYNNQIALVDLDSNISGYAFTPADVLAEDWYVQD